jgi:hypothetical protein
LVQLRQFGAVGLALGANLVGVFGDRFHQCFLHASHHEAPEIHVEPDVRIVSLSTIGRFDETIRGNGIAHGDGLDAVAHALEHVAQSRLQVKAVVHHHIRLGQTPHVALGGFVHVRIHAGPHETGHLHKVSAHGVGRVGYHAGGGHHIELFTRLARGRTLMGFAAGDAGGSDQETDGPAQNQSGHAKTTPTCFSGSEIRSS